MFTMTDRGGAAANGLLTALSRASYSKCNIVTFKAGLREVSGPGNGRRHPSEIPMRNPTRLLYHSLAVAVGMSLCGAASAAPTQYPLTLENCRETVTFAGPPKRVVAIGQTQTEILYALGLGDRVVGTAVWFSPVAKRYEAVNAGVKRLADNDPSFEAVVAREPDLVTAMFEWHVGPNGIVGKRDQFARLKVPTYVSPADCVGKDNSGPGDGVRTQMFSMELVYRNIREYGQIFDVADRADKLVAELREREEQAVKSVATLKARDVPVVVWFSSRDIKGDGFMAGKTGVPAYILSKLGARNIITSNEEWPLVGWESIAAADPAVIVVVRMDRRRFPADDIDLKLNFLKTDPVASKLGAISENRIVVMDVGATRAGLDTIDGVEALAKAIAGFGIAP
ncbi:iron complex transport system substrate-binding protein [Bosea lathyri]|uniref:Iron complex transport system substrate-binding protein n=2 Tax=Bosea lathyri TaxID=1036778 RepID=A0A1H6D1Q9_9HYPH|nr:iron complex transport system substrate-binding protein [Bosea lathyri]